MVGSNNYLQGYKEGREDMKEKLSEAMVKKTIALLSLKAN